MARVLLLFGGKSEEHEVSCVSAVAVMAALESGGHQVILVGIDRRGEWHLADRPRRSLVASGRPVSLRVPSGTLSSGDDEIGFDVVFPVLHGPFGEDGTIQGLFEIAGTPYVGCDVLSSALAMEKDLTKQVLVQAGLPTAPWTVVRLEEFSNPSAAVARVVAQLGLPVFVKPVQLGSSVGVSRATTEAELEEGIEAALRHGAKVIVEEAIKGREIEVAVLEGPRVSNPGEIVIEGDWYDYRSKYHDDTSRFVTPAELTSPQVDRVRDLAGRAFTALECHGLARVDFFLERGRGFLVNEVNTMPGFTPISGFPKMWEASGLSYPELCNELVDAALNR
jgi:D-alanine-D-alanine ligase